MGTATVFTCARSRFDRGRGADKHGRGNEKCDGTAGTDTSESDCGKSIKQEFRSRKNSCSKIKLKILVNICGRMCEL